MRYQIYDEVMKWRSINERGDKNSYEELEYLLQRGLDANDFIYPLLRHCLGSSFLKLLINYGLDVNHPDNLIIAIQLCDVELVQKFLTPEYNLSRTGMYFYNFQSGTPLFIAIQIFLRDCHLDKKLWLSKMLVIIELLLMRNAPMNEGPVRKTTNIEEKQGTRELIKLLERYGYKNFGFI